MAKIKKRKVKRNPVAKKLREFKPRVIKKKTRIVPEISEW